MAASLINSTLSTSVSSEQQTSHAPVSAELLVCLIIIDFIFGTMTIAGNFCLFVTIYRDTCRCLRTPSVFLIANLSIADFFMGFVNYLRAVELIYIYCGLGHHPILNIAQYFVGGVSILVAVSTLMAMSYTRYVAIIRPLQYPQRVTNARAKIAIAVIWINALVMSVLPLADVKKANFLLVYCYSHFVVPSIVLTAVYVKIYKTVALQRQELKDVRASLTVANRRRQLEGENRMVTTFLLILVIFYLSFVPYFIKVHILYFCPCRNSYAYNVYHFLSNEFLSVSSMVDPFLYGWRLGKLNRSFRLCFFRQRKSRKVTVKARNRTRSNHDKMSKRKEACGPVVCLNVTNTITDY